ncbi:MAG: hypothetical protein DSY76_04175, partial [Bacteroidetes bacterium]
FKSFISSLNLFATEVNATADIINSTIGATIKPSWNDTDDFAGTTVKHNDKLWLCMVDPCVNSEPTDSNSDWLKIWEETRLQNVTYFEDDTQYSGSTIHFLSNTFTPTRDGEILVEITTYVGVDYYSDGITLKLHKDGTAIENGFYSRYAYSYSSYAGYMLHPYTLTEKISVQKGVNIDLEVVHTGQSDTYINRVNNGASYGHAKSSMKITEL